MPLCDNSYIWLISYQTTNYLDTMQWITWQPLHSMMQYVEQLNLQQDISYLDYCIHLTA